MRALTRITRIQNRLGTAERICTLYNNETHYGKTRTHSTFNSQCEICSYLLDPQIVEMLKQLISPAMISLAEAVIGSVAVAAVAVRLVTVGCCCSHG